MRMGTQSRQYSFAASAIPLTLLAVFLILSLSQPANALPAFARKYGLRCSACHESWPMLNYFGQKFKDNGYQLMNDRDAPIWQNASYWPITLRMTPFWSRESTSKAAVDTAPTGEQRMTTTGFNLSGLDILTGGTLEKNISFLLVPSADETGAFHFESVNVRFDNLLKSPWLNVKVGKFELDSFISEKRTLTLSANGGAYQLFHFIPVGDGNIFGQIGDNQIGAEWMGHSANDRTRLSAAVFSSTDGNVDLPYGQNSYSAFFAGSQAFSAGKLGVQRLGGIRHVRRSSDDVPDQRRRSSARFGNWQQDLQPGRVRGLVLPWSTSRLPGLHATWGRQCLVRRLLRRNHRRAPARTRTTTRRASSRPELAIQRGMEPSSKRITSTVLSSRSSSAQNGFGCRSRHLPPIHPIWVISTIMSWATGITPS